MKTPRAILWPLVALVVLLVPLGNDLEAQYSYCYVAVVRCNESCMTYGSWYGPIIVTACKAGCWVGYNRCVRGLSPP